jgi:hypothetical protein
MEERTRKNYTGTIIIVSIIINVALAAYSGYSFRQTRARARAMTAIQGETSIPIVATYQIGG